MSQISKFQIIDGGVESYFKRNGDSNYTNKHGNGKFLQYILDEQLDDPELPIEDELGDHSDPNDCAYTWFYNNSETKFPIPTNMHIPNEKMELFIFYILQYIFKYTNPPTDKYIETDILPKVNEKVISYDSMLSQSDSYVMNSCVTKTNKYKPNINYESKEGSISDCESIEGYDTNININNTPNISIKRISKKLFKPEYASRAHLNIYTDKQLIKNLLYNINESFDNELNLYYYTDISAALQMNDKQIFIYEIILKNNNKFIFGIINYDLHCKNTNMNLYGIIIPNNNNKKQQNKWLWKLDSFINANHIMNLYGVSINELPKSSRQMKRFKSELNQNLVIEEKIITETDWFQITQIKSLKRNISKPKVDIILTKELWISECLNSLRNNNCPLIPVVLNKNNNHWIEWLKIIYIKSQNIWIGISFKYDLNINKLSVESICLDSGDIYNKHGLIGIHNIKYTKQLNDFKISINEIIFSDNNQNIINNKIIILKQQITSQQNSIVKLKESIQKINNNNNNKKYNNNNNIQSVSIENEIKEIINNNKYKMNMKYEQDFVSQIVDDVIKKYNVCIFKTNPIGIRQNIYIAKEFVHLWINNIQNKFENIEEMYYYFDVITCIQMIQKESKKYIINNKNEEFLTVIINYELYDFNGNLLYGIINKQFNNKYKYKLIALMNENEIMNNFGIYSHDLPDKSRENKDFINKLLLKRKICKQDLNGIKWSNLKIYKTQSINNNKNNNDLINNKSITITRNVMNEYININLERINNNNNNLIPILIIDKYNNLYNIEWILIVNIIHKNCPIGVSFKYNNLNSKYLYQATSIYLNKNQIEMKHKLIGLKNNYCKNIKYFNIKRLKFKSNKDTVIDDDDDNNTFVNINTEQIKYKQLIQNEKTKIKQLQLQLSQIQNEQQQVVYIQQQFQNQQQLFNLNKIQSQYQYPMYNNNNTNVNINVNNMNQQWISNSGY